MRAVALLLFASLACAAGDLAESVNTAIDASPEAKQCFWGIGVVDAATGSLVYARNTDKFFVPASNAKLFTTALALTRLGPDYRFVTRIEADALPDARGRVRELRLIGGGDPNLSARILPYVKDKTAPNPLSAIEALAGQAVARGIRFVDGPITGDDTAYQWEPYPEGWAVDDPVWEYGAPVSALTVNDNAFTLRIDPAAEIGAPAVFTLSPAVEYLIIHNRTRTIPAGPAKVDFERIPGSRELVATGTVAIRGARQRVLLAIDDPALFAAMALRDALLERGVRIAGQARAVHRSPERDGQEWRGAEVARHTSEPLAEILQVINKVSQNLHTEMVLREIVRVKNGTGTREDGLKEIAAFLKELGVEDGQYRFEDASGLSRLTLVTPETVLAVLLHMYRSPYRDLWIDTLPAGGVDGTLSTRFDHAPARVNIRAKTGSISHVSTLSGYALRPDGGVRVFSIMANNYNSTATPIRKVIDRIALALLD